MIKNGERLFIEPGKVSCALGDPKTLCWRAYPGNVGRGVIGRTLHVPYIQFVRENLAIGFSVRQ